MKYEIIVKQSFVEDLVRAANEMIKAGWQPLGGIALARRPDGIMLYAQAMILPEKLWNEPELKRIKVDIDSFLEASTN